MSVLRDASLVFVLLTAGCGAAESGSVPADSSQQRSSDTCRGGPASPVAISEAVDALRSRGFDVVSEDRHQICDLESIVGHLTNSPGSGPLSENAEQKGHLACTVYRSALPQEELEEDEEGYKITFYGANLRCIIYIRDEDAGAGVEPLRAAMQEIAQQR